MTVLEAIKANLSDAHGMVVSDDHFMKALVDAGLNSGATYTVQNKSAVDNATIRIYDLLLGGANMSEGGISYSIDLSSVRLARDAMKGVKKVKTVKADRWW